QTKHSAGKPNPQAGRVANLRRSLDGAHFYCRRFAENPRLRHRLVQWRAGAESLRTEGPDGIHWKTFLQEARGCADPAAGARRSQPAHQLSQYLGEGTKVGRTVTTFQIVSFAESGGRFLHSPALHLSRAGKFPR